MADVQRTTPVFAGGSFLFPFNDPSFVLRTDGFRFLPQGLQVGHSFLDFGFAPGNRIKNWFVQEPLQQPQNDQEIDDLLSLRKVLTLITIGWNQNTSTPITFKHHATNLSASFIKALLRRTCHGFQR
jgi:hypothetical protein